jgi:hypothetical protein
MLDELRITIGQANHKGSFEDWVDTNCRCRIKKPAEQLKSLYRTIDTAK